jgi:hypothetical protein
MAEQLAADRMRDRHRAAERHRSRTRAGGSPPEVAAPIHRQRRVVARYAGQILIALGQRLAGDDRAGASLAGHGTRRSTA